jgi:hypothetical protein
MAASKGEGLEGEGAGRAIINLAAMRVTFGHCPKDQVPNFYRLDDDIESAPVHVTDPRTDTIARTAVDLRVIG